jgi:predicted ATPase
LIPTLGGVVVAAHACGASGILTALAGQTRVRVWKSDALHAIALPGPREDVPQNCRNIVLNKEAEYERKRPVAIVNANDVSDPAQLSDPQCTCFIKMAEVSVEGLRQAFLDSESRIRLHSDEPAGARTELIAATWRGGLLDGEFIRFNESLNVLIGGRGAGKSTLIESIRYALDIQPKGIEAGRQHQAMMRHVLGGGAEVSLLLRSPRPSPQYYLVSRIYGSRPRVRNQRGELVQNVALAGLLGEFEIYGQHEISELTRDGIALAQILRRFQSSTLETVAKREQLERLQESRFEIISVLQEIQGHENALAALPTLEERQRRFVEAGLAKKLKVKTDIDGEEAILDEFDELTGSLEEIAASVEGFDSDVGDIASQERLADLPNAEGLAKLGSSQEKLRARMGRVARYIRHAVKQAEIAAASVRTEWQSKKDEAEQTYQTALRDLRAQGQDGTEYISVERQIAELRPRQNQQAAAEAKLGDLYRDRTELLAAWDSRKAEDLRSLQRAASNVSRKLASRVRVTVLQKGVEVIETVFRDHCQGQLSQAVERLSEQADLNMSQLAGTIRDGAQSLGQRYGIAAATAEKLAGGGEALALKIEEVEIPASARVELNVGSNAAPVWKTLDDLSTGQKATAVLLLLLLDYDVPLIVDQPEDDLDNRFITECIVETMRSEKHKRQFLFSTHNANIPVLGDAEQIVALRTELADGTERAVMEEELKGSIDMPAVKRQVYELLEGGRRAFELRQKKYGF